MFNEYKDREIIITGNEFSVITVGVIKIDYRLSFKYTTKVGIVSLLLHKLYGKEKAEKYIDMIDNKYARKSDGVIFDTLGGNHLVNGYNSFPIYFDDRLYHNMFKSVEDMNKLLESVENSLLSVIPKIDQTIIDSEKQNNDICDIFVGFKY